MMEVETRQVMRDGSLRATHTKTHSLHMSMYNLASMNGLESCTTLNTRTCTHILTHLIPTQSFLTATLQAAKR